VKEENTETRWRKKTHKAKDLIFPNPWTLLNMMADFIASSTLSNSVENPNLSSSEMTRQVTPFYYQPAFLLLLPLDNILRGLPKRIAEKEGRTSGVITPSSSSMVNLGFETPPSAPET